MAINELLIAVSARLEKLARKMLGGFPAVRAEVETGDILQAALIRLVRSLKDIRPDSMRPSNLAAVQMRRELLDLARSPTVRRRAAEFRKSDDAGLIEGMPAAPDSDFDRWARLHEAVEQLPADLRRSLRSDSLSWLDATGNRRIASDQRSTGSSIMGRGLPQTSFSVEWRFARPLSSTAEAARVAACRHRAFPTGPSHDEGRRTVGRTRRSLARGGRIRDAG